MESSSTGKAMLIVGLGNPGGQYISTRHNVGFEVIDLLAKRHHIYVRAKRHRALLGESSIEGRKVILIKPQTFMNLSGQAVGAVARQCRVSAENILLVSDDVNLPLGKLRIRAGGSAGGHNGLKSVIGALGTDAFPRIRIGVGVPNYDMVDHVLSKFRRNEIPIIGEAISRATDAIECILTDGIDQAMNSFNG